MKRIVDVSQTGRHLARKHGFMTISENGIEIGRIALDEIQALIVHAHGVTYSNSLLISLAEIGAITVLCNANHFPIAYITALDGHHSQTGRIAGQLNAKLPMKKQMWKQIIVQKIKMQAAVLSAFDLPNVRLLVHSNNVKSGDPNNIEAQAARHYWPLIMGKGFLRDRNADGANALLNYGYTVLRASVARAVIASGLHPSIGIHHHNIGNPFALADDLIEPFRPLVDTTVKGMLNQGICTVTPEAKNILTKILTLDLDLGKTRSPVTTAINNLCLSVVHSFKIGHVQLSLPSDCMPIEFKHLGKSDGNL